MNCDMKKTGQRIQRLRTAHGYTQEELARALNIDRSNLSRLESGKRSCSLDLLVQLSMLFNVTLDYLIFGQDNPSLADTGKVGRMKESIDKIISQLEELKLVL